MKLGSRLQFFNLKKREILWASRVLKHRISLASFEVNVNIHFLIKLQYLFRSRIRDKQRKYMFSV